MIRLKIAVLAPIPSPSIKMAVIVNPGDLINGLRVWRKWEIRLRMRKEVGAREPGRMKVKAGRPIGRSSPHD